MVLILRYPDTNDNTNHTNHNSKGNPNPTNPTNPNTRYHCEYGTRFSRIAHVSTHTTVVWT